MQQAEIKSEANGRVVDVTYDGGVGDGYAVRWSGYLAFFPN